MITPPPVTGNPSDVGSWTSLRRQFEGEIQMNRFNQASDEEPRCCAGAGLGDLTALQMALYLSSMHVGFILLRDLAVETIPNSVHGLSIMRGSLMLGTLITKYMYTVLLQTFKIECDRPHLSVTLIASVLGAEALSLRSSAPSLSSNLSLHHVAPPTNFSHHNNPDYTTARIHHGQSSRRCH